MTITLGNLFKPFFTLELQHGHVFMTIGKREFYWGRGRIG